MMESRRRHGSELFICFTSRASSSSSIRISTKPILSPGRTDKFRSETPSSLPSSLSRRISIKSGHASPMFPPSSGKKTRGSAFDSHSEPSSPKVTCIGQVRVKTKKNSKQSNILRTRSIQSTRSSFRKLDLGFEGGNQTPYQSQIQHPHRNQRWIHFPFTICEALKALGSELNCFSSCGKQEQVTESGRIPASSRHCRSVLARLFVDLQDEERPSEDTLEEDVEVSVPPKNALLLMRCRSDPMRMSALANRLLESSVQDDDESIRDEHESTPDGEVVVSVCDEDQTSKIVLLEVPDIRISSDETDLDIIDLPEITEEVEDERNAVKDEGDDEQTEKHELKTESEMKVKDSEEREAEEDKVGERGDAVELPECLVLMLREPKLSMEVSKETWICSTDFIRLLPDRRCRRRSTDSGNTMLPETFAPPRSSGSFPVMPSFGFSAESIAAIIEQKLANAVAYEPYILTRCKSEPMKNSARLAPEACFWNSRKITGARVPTTGIRVPAAGLSF